MEQLTLDLGDIVYLTIVSGVYWQETLGIFTNKDEAMKAARAFFAAEEDGYHDVEIIPIHLNHHVTIKKNGNPPHIERGGQRSTEYFTNPNCDWKELPNPLPEG